MLPTHAVGIDLGTTYSCIAHLNEHGEPVTIANQEGELSTPSVVLFEDGEVVVGTEALRNAIVRPDRVVQNAKRFMGDPDKTWTIDGRSYTPIDVASFVLKKLLSAAQEQIGPIEQAVITVPAQFSDAQRHATVQAGHKAGLQRVDIINEPVAAALCYVLGTEGLWFTELAAEQRVMVYDLGGGTFDLSLVKYHKNEVSVIASLGDLNLGGIDWNSSLENAIASQFAREFGADPRADAQSRQALAWEVEQTKRSLTVRPRAALNVQHAGQRKTYQVEKDQFEKLTRHLVEKTVEITKQLLNERKMGWAHVDVVLTTGGSSRMPMIRERLQQLSGRTLNTSLSPDQSIAHGATYYAGMLLSNSKFAKSILNAEAHERLSQVRQRGVNARALGILVRDKSNESRIPHYLIPPNTPLPASVKHKYGTVGADQRRVTLPIVEGGTAGDQRPVKLGECIIDGLPPNLPEGSVIEVTITYDEQARVHVSARDVASGKVATTEIVRQENVVPQLGSDLVQQPELAAPPKPKLKAPAADVRSTPRADEAPKPRRKPEAAPPAANIGGLDIASLEDATMPSRLAEADEPIPLCNTCGEVLDHRGRCPKCPPMAPPRKPAASVGKPQPARMAKPGPAARPKPRPTPPPVRTPAVPPPEDSDIIELGEEALVDSPARPPAPPRKPPTRTPSPAARRAPGPPRARDAGEDEFWRLGE